MADEYFPNRDIVEKFIKCITRYSDEDKSKIAAAAIFAAKKHGDQKRKTGDPYISHPMAVAEILMQIGMDADTVTASLLHDTLEDTDTTFEEIKTLFGESVSEMVDAVTKISRITDNKSIQESETIKKMFFAMSKDLRVIMIKLADKLHNMRTIEGLPPERRRTFSEECLEIFAPMADSLGMSQIKAELEDISLKTLKPDTYDYINGYILEKKGEYNAYIKQVAKAIEEACAKEGITDIEITGRVKHAYSIYQKIKRRKKELDEIYDILGIRVICRTPVDCYTILGVIHSTWLPIEGRFKDYIAMPKANNYQSLHTTVLGPGNRHLEIQIRTREMHKTAEEGVAAHWAYKASTGSESGLWKKVDSMNYTKIINKIKAWSKEIEQNDDFMDEIKNELLKDSIVLFTPQGHVIELPDGSTALDFAYKIHSEVGNHCSGAKADGSIIPLSRPLRNTEIIEILTSPSAHPNQQWLTYAKTTQAKKKIRLWLNRNEAQNIPIAARAEKGDEKNKSGRAVAAPILTDGIRFIPHGNKEGIVIGEESNILYDFAKCCNPVHGDPIVAYITRGRGYVIHRADCPNLKNMSESDVRLVDVEWDNNQPVRRFSILAKSNSEIFGEMDNAVKKHGGHLISGSLSSTPEGLCGTFTVGAEDEDSMRKTISAIRAIPSIIRIQGV